MKPFDRKHPLVTLGLAAALTLALLAGAASTAGAQGAGKLEAWQRAGRQAASAQR